MVALMTGYALVCQGVRISVSNVAAKAKGRKTTIATKGANQMKDNIIELFGVPQMRQLLSLQLEHEGIKLEGFVSTCEQGCGRRTGDRQAPAASVCTQTEPLHPACIRQPCEALHPESVGAMFLVCFLFVSRNTLPCNLTSVACRQYLFVNKRPVDLFKLTRTVNETYHKYNPQQLPMLVLNITIDPSTYDVNVTPDKRTILLHNMPELQQALAGQLDAIYEPRSRCGGNVDLSGGNADPLVQSLSQSRLQFERLEAEPQPASAAEPESEQIEELLTDSSLAGACSEPAQRRSRARNSQQAVPQTDGESIKAAEDTEEYSDEYVPSDADADADEGVALGNGGVLLAANMPA